MYLPICLKINYLRSPSLVLVGKKFKEYVGRKTMDVYVNSNEETDTSEQYAFIYYGYLFQHCYSEFNTYTTLYKSIIISIEHQIYMKYCNRFLNKLLFCCLL